MVVYSNHRKYMKVCDLESRDGLGLGIQIDPSGAQAPITYYDDYPVGSQCFEHNVGYSVRKWRIVSVYHNGNFHGAKPWRVDPLPRPDF